MKPPIPLNSLKSPRSLLRTPRPPPAPSRRTSARFYRFPVIVQVVLGSTSMPVASLMKLQRCAVVSLDQRVGDPVDVVVNGKVVARGEIGWWIEATSTLRRIAGRNRSRRWAGAGGLRGREYVQASAGQRKNAQWPGEGGGSPSVMGHPLAARLVKYLDQPDLRTLARAAAALGAVAPSTCGPVGRGIRRRLRGLQATISPAMQARRAFCWAKRSPRRR